MNKNRKSIFGFRIAEDALFIIWWKFFNNFSAQEQVAILYEKISVYLCEKNTIQSRCD